MINTGATAFRSLIGAGLAIFSSRWVLNGLGHTDFGLYSVVGSIIAFVVLLNTVMASSVARHYAYAIGQNLPGEINRWFNVAFGIHLALASVLVLAGDLIGEYVIIHYLTIPPERLTACLWVFRLSLLAAFFSMISMPFVAMFTARQYILIQACWLTGNSILTFFLALSLGYIVGDRLIFYTIGIVCIIIGTQLGMATHASIKFKDCRIRWRYWFDRAKSKEVFSFAGWSLFGPLGSSLRNQGSAVLLNLYFGPKLNAAYGIANQVSSAANMLTDAMLHALAPEMTSSEGRGNRERMLSLAQRASKLGAIIIIIFVLPLIMEMHYVLKLWLREPPAYSALFCQLLLVSILIDRASAGTMLAVQAHGRIAAYQATLGTCIMLTLPLAWLFLKLGAHPPSIFWAFIIVASILTFGRVLWMRRLLEVPCIQWLKQVLLPCCLVTLAGITAMAPVHFLITNASLARLAMTFTCGILAMTLTTWFLAFDSQERAFFKQSYRKFILKFSSS